MAVTWYDPAHLDDKGRCCGRKPLVYKRPDHHLFCTRCDREFDRLGNQRPNWAWIERDGQFAKRNPTTGEARD